MLNFNFNLNEMQKKAQKLIGENIVFKASTGKGRPRLFY